MTATSALVALTEQVAAGLTAGGIPAKCVVVDGDPYVRLSLAHDGTTTAWVPLDNPTWVIVRDQPDGPHRIDQNGPLSKGWEACADVECLTLVLWEWVLRTRARSVGP